MSANALFFLVEHRMKLGRGVAIASDDIEPDFAKKFGKTAIYFTNPFGLPSEFSIVKNNSDTGRIYMGVFITPAEFEYFSDRGAAEFESLLERKAVDPFDISRCSSI